MDQETRNQFKKLRDFLDKNMVTKGEIDARFETLPTKADINRLYNAVDGIAGDYKTFDQELTVIGERTSRMEGWIMKAAEKIGLDYKP